MGTDPRPDQTRQTQHAKSKQRVLQSSPAWLKPKPKSMAAPSTTSTSTKSGRPIRSSTLMAAAIGVHELGIECFAFSRIPLGRGIVRSMHGPLPAPAPATLELLKGLPVVGHRRGRRNGHAHRRGAHAHVGENVWRSTADDNRKDRLRRRTKVFTGQPNLFRVMLRALLIRSGKLKRCW